jgi:hypothetical protein
LKGVAAQGLYEITLREEFARMNELTGSLTLTSGVQARATDKSISDSLEGTVVWEYDPMECPQTIVRLYKGMMKAYVNQSSSYKGSIVVVEHQDKDQAAGLEVAESFILCGHHAFRTHIKNIAVFVHKDDRMEVAQGRFNGKEGEADLTRLESGMSFMQVRASMSMKEKLRQVRGAICENRRDIARTRLEAIAGADNPTASSRSSGGGTWPSRQAGPCTSQSVRQWRWYLERTPTAQRRSRLSSTARRRSWIPSATSSKARGPPYTATTRLPPGTRWVASGTAATHS